MVAASQRQQRPCQAPLRAGPRPQGSAEAPRAVLSVAPERGRVSGSTVHGGLALLLGRWWKLSTGGNEWPPGPGPDLTLTRDRPCLLPAAWRVLEATNAGCQTRLHGYRETGQQGPKALTGLWLDGRGCPLSAASGRGLAGARIIPPEVWTFCARTCPGGGGACAALGGGEVGTPWPSVLPLSPTCFARQLPEVLPRGPGVSCRPHRPDPGQLRGWRGRHGNCWSGRGPSGGAQGTAVIAQGV